MVRANNLKGSPLLKWLFHVAKLLIVEKSKWLWKQKERIKLQAHKTHYLSMANIFYFILNVR